MFWHIELNFFLQYYRSSFSVVNLCQFLWELCPFWNAEYWKYTVFRTFLLHALKYWAEILHITLFYCTTDQIRVSSICVNFLGVMLLLELRVVKIHSWIFFIWLCFTVLQIKFQCRQFVFISVGVMPLLERRILEIHSIPYFSLICFDILSWKFSYDFVKFTKDQVRVSSLYLRLAFRPSVHPFSAFLLHALTNLAEILNLTLVS